MTAIPGIARLELALSQQQSAPPDGRARSHGELGRLEQWYQAQCDGDGEREWGVRIATLDNPGRTVHIDLEETTLSGRTYVRTDIQRSHSDWLTAKVSDGAFHASCGPLNLSEVLRLFREWATSVSPEP
ncbi:immunity 53 family protein [Streptomyces sp. NPDC058420]|uniref:immunity 53 family protein n=1 Tax=Streptomyces sp. NPDC058420 TaxID=3346489 RepID=UPI00364C570E